MRYGCGCAVVGKPNRFTLFAEMMPFWLPLSTMNCSGEPFTHIWEWNRCSSSYGSSGSSFWIFTVAIVALGSASIICFPLSFPFSGSDSDSEHASDSEALISATSDCLAQQSLVLWVELLWNSHHFPVSFFGLTVLFFACGFDKLFCFVLRFRGTFPLLLIHRSKVLLLLFEFLLNLGSISVCRTKQGDVKEFHFLLNVSV